MKIVSGTFMMHFPAVTDGMLRKLVALETAVADYFEPFSYSNVTDDAPYNHSRASTFAKNTKDVSLDITAQSLIFHANASSECVADLEKCYEYMDSTIALLYNSMVEHICPKFYYSGVIVQLEFDDIKNPSAYIQETLLNKRPNQVFFDLNLRFTQIYKETFYINLEVLNKRKYSGNISPMQEITPLHKMKDDGEVLGVNIDVNDRYGFNFTPEYSSSYDKIQTIISTIKELLDGKLQKFWEEGVIVQ